MAGEGVCDSCARTAAVHPVTYRWNVGLVVLWWRTRVAGSFCAA